MEHRVRPLLVTATENMQALFPQWLRSPFIALRVCHEEQLRTVPPSVLG